MANRNQGISSRNVRSVSQRLGDGNRKVSVGATGQLGVKVGAHAELKGKLPYRGENRGKVYSGGEALRPAPMGNAVAAATKCGPGGSRNLYGQSGSQQQYGAAAAGNPPQRGELFPGWPLKPRP
jgi:hypothetical protein